MAPGGGGSSSSDPKEEPVAEEGERRRSSEYEEDERVLAYHAEFIYEAKILKLKQEAGQWKYFIHYLGWKKSWDEWVGTDRLLKHNAANLGKQKQLLKELEEQKRSGKKVASPPARPAKSPKPATPKAAKSSNSSSKPKKEEESKPAESTPVASPGVRSSKRKQEQVEAEASREEVNGSQGRKQVVDLPMPVALKKQLVEDEQFVCYQGQLVKLPRKPNVGELLDQFVESKRKKDGRVNEALSEIMKGLRSYFDRALPAMLLYKNERPQFNETLPPGSVLRPSEVYGAEHLLRLFTKLPELLGYVNMEEETVAQLRTHLTDFMRFMQKNQSDILLSSYDGPKVEPRFEPPSSASDTKREKRART